MYVRTQLYHANTCMCSNNNETNSKNESTNNSHACISGYILPRCTQSGRECIYNNILLVTASDSYHWFSYFHVYLFPGISVMHRPIIALVHKEICWLKEKLFSTDEFTIIPMSTPWLNMLCNDPPVIINKLIRWRKKSTCKFMYEHFHKHMQSLLKSKLHQIVV